MKIGFVPLDGKFPDYRRVIPREFSGEVAQYNADYLVRCKKAFESLGASTTPTISYNGNGPCMATSSAAPDALCVVMPIRSDAKMGDVPAWLADTIVDQPEVVPATEEETAES